MRKILTVYLSLLFILMGQVGVHAETAHSRMLRTHTLRCGYLPYEPFIIKDINTGKLSGIPVDYVNQVAAQAGLTVDWVAEINIDQLVPALDGGRIDAFCIPVTPDANWEKVLNFSGYLGGLPYYTYVKADSTLTAEQLETARFTVVDGYALTKITHQIFPKAEYKGLPQTTSTAEVYDQLRFGKADALVNESISAINYMRNNPGIVRRFSDVPLIAVKMYLAAPKTDTEMARYFDDTFSADKPDNLALIKELLVKYEVPEGALLLGEDCKNHSVGPQGERTCIPAKR